MKNNVLNNLNNYNVELTENETVYFLKYVGIINDLIDVFTKSININNTAYVKHVLIKAIKNVSYIYSFLLLYTKHLALSIYHTRESILYYVEFIGQIGDDNHKILSLNSNDATIFMYNKTIYNINQDFREKYTENESTKEILKQVNLYIDIYNSILIQYIYNIEDKTDILPDLQKIVYTKIYKITKELIQLKLSSSSTTNKLEKIKIIINLIHSHCNKYIIKQNYLNILELLIIKFKKIVISEAIFKQNIENDNIEEKLLQLGTVHKIVNYLTTGVK